MSRVFYLLIMELKQKPDRKGAAAGWGAGRSGVYQVGNPNDHLGFYCGCSESSFALLATASVQDYTWSNFDGNRVQDV